MNKFILGILFTSVTFFTGYDPAVADTGTVDVTANVEQLVTVTVTAGSNTFTVTPGSAITDQDIATISIDSNDPTGYDVTLASANESSVVNGTDGMDYTVKYNGGSDTVLTSAGVNVEDASSVTGGPATRSLTLSIAAAETAGRAASAYTDTITVEIIGK